jgi:hypothetical protein
MTENDPRPVLRQELARVFKNQRVIRAFEKIFDLIPPEFNNQQDQIDQLFIIFSGIDNELSQAPTISDLREQVEALRCEVEGLKQGPII